MAAEKHEISTIEEIRRSDGGLEAVVTEQMKEAIQRRSIKPEILADLQSGKLQIMGYGIPGNYHFEMGGIKDMNRLSSWDEAFASFLRLLEDDLEYMSELSLPEKDDRRYSTTKNFRTRARKALDAIR